MENLINGTWVLEKEIKSPWKNVLIPVFLDFDEKTGMVELKGYGELTKSNTEFSIYLKKMKIGCKMEFEIQSLTNEKLIIKYANSEYNYFKLKKSKSLIDFTKLKYTLCSEQWTVGNSILEFKDDVEELSGVKKHEMIEYKENKKFFGTYCFDSFKNNYFIILLIDGRPNEMMLKVEDFENSAVHLKTSSGIELNLTKVLPNKS